MDIVRLAKGPTGLGLAWGAKGHGPGRLGFGFGGPRVLGRAGLAFIFRLDNSICFRLATAIIFRLDTAIIFRLDTAIIFRLAIIHQFCNKYALFDF